MLTLWDVCPCYPNRETCELSNGPGKELSVRGHWLQWCDRLAARRSSVGLPTIFWTLGPLPRHWAPCGSRCSLGIARLRLLLNISKPI